MSEKIEANDVFGEAVKNMIGQSPVGSHHNPRVLDGIIRV